LEKHPEYAVAFRRVIERSRELGPDEVLRLLEGLPSLLPDRRHGPPPEGDTLAFE
jgi:hypothetical protein